MILSTADIALILENCFGDFRLDAYDNLLLGFSTTIFISSTKYGFIVGATSQTFQRYRSSKIDQIRSSRYLIVLKKYLAANFLNNT